jgi:hypothetical protein
MNILIEASPCLICVPPFMSYFLHNFYITRSTCENIKLPTWIFTEEHLWMEQDARILNWPVLLQSWFNPRFRTRDIVSTIFSRIECDAKLKNQSRSSQILPSNCDWRVAACPALEQESGRYPLVSTCHLTGSRNSLPPVNIHVRCLGTGFRRGNETLCITWDHIEIKTSIEALFKLFRWCYYNFPEEINSSEWNMER